MLFHITQTHTPETCPKDEGGSSILINPKAKGIKLRATYGAFTEHVIYYVVEADSMKSVHEFLMPGLKRCTCSVTPVVEEAVAK